MARWSVPLIAGVLLLGCDGGGTPDGWRATPGGSGPVVRWDLEVEPLPELPLPNDVATYADPSSPTGRRLNVSLLVPTRIESDTRRLFDELDGWGTYAPISVSFDGELDLADLMERQGGSDHFSVSDFPRHAVYVIDLETGVPAPLDLNGGNFPVVALRTDQYFPNDPRSAESNILFETVEEDTNGNGVLDPGEDTDFDGVLDHPNTLDGLLTGDPLDTVDRMAWFYERETNTLILRPILPLRPESRYAVVLTDRLVGARGRPVRSPFPSVHHVSQRRDLESLPDIFRSKPHLYGDLSTRGWDGVAFAWSFTTQSVTRDLDTIRAGLYGQGTMARLAEQFGPDVVPAPMQGGTRGFPCEPGRNVLVAPGDAFRAALETAVREAFELNDDQVAVILASYESLDHVVAIFFESPYMLGDPDAPSLDETFRMDWQTGNARVNREVLSALVFVPKETATHRQPFPTVFYVHGHGSSSTEPLPYAGLILQHGVAVVTMNAQGHGAELDPVLTTVVESFFADACLAPAAGALLAGRARDLDGDGSLDSGANFWTAYAFHTRDEVRQTIVDHLRAIQIFRAFDGTRMARPTSLDYSINRTQLAFDGDYDGDGDVDLLGDFDGDGTPDTGGPDGQYGFTGGSLGGIMTGVMAGVEPAVTVAVPIVGAGGLSDVAPRTTNGAVVPAFNLRLMGPLVVTRVSGGPDDDTSCAAGQHSLRWSVADLTHRGDVEFACLPAEALDGDSVIFVHNLTNGEVGCAGSQDDTGAIRVHIPADAGDRILVEVWADGADQVRYGECTWRGDRPRPDQTIDTWQVGSGRGAGECRQRCARFQSTVWEREDPLVSPAAGWGRRRQTPDLRRVFMLGQIALESADPINYARRVFLEPVTAPDVTPHARNLFVVNTVGDPNVVVATGNAYARAAGIVPFLPPDAPEELADWRAPADFMSRYGFPTPNDMLIQYHVIEGVSRIDRHPVDGAMGFLADVDNLSDGVLLFDPVTQDQSDAPEAVAPVRPDTPLRWARLTRAVSSPSDDVWSVARGDDQSALVNAYVVPEGIHGFDTLLDSSVPFDMSQYVLNLIAHYAATGGTDLPYLSDPSGHHCLEDSSCTFIGE